MVRVSGAEPKGLRLEAAGGIGFNPVWRFWLFARGGLAVDGIYSDAAPASTSATGFMSISAQLRM
jgi:hypothetical protein